MEEDTEAILQGGAEPATREMVRRALGTQFTCFTGTKVQILTQAGARLADPGIAAILALLVQNAN